MQRLMIFTCVAMAAFLCLAAAAHAHKVNIFAYVDGDSVVTDSGYSRSKRVHGGTVEVYDMTTGNMLLAGQTDENGKFDFTIPAEARGNKADLLLRLKAGAGHQAEWIVRHDEFVAAGGLFSAEKDHVHAAVSKPQESMDSSEVKVFIRTELAPIKQMLAELSQPGPGVTEIVGGFGYIFGIFGIIAYMKSRKSR